MTTLVAYGATGSGTRNPIALALIFVFMAAVVAYMIIRRK